MEDSFFVIHFLPPKKVDSEHEKPENVKTNLTKTAKINICTCKSGRACSVYIQFFTLMEIIEGPVRVNL